MYKNHHTNDASTVISSHNSRKFKRRHTHCGDIYATPRKQGSYGRYSKETFETEYVKKDQDDFSQQKRTSECRTENSYLKKPPEFYVPLAPKPNNKSPQSARQSVVKAEFQTRMKSHSDPVFNCGSFFYEHFYFEPCQAFQLEGICFKGTECPYLHLEPNRPFGKVAVKLLQILEKSVSADEGRSIGDVLETTEKYGRYLSVFKQIVYRYDKNDLFLTF
jgi:hypothetical protein